MASNRFNQRPVPRRRPAICHPPPVPPYVPVPLVKPRQLTGFVRWTDLDPAIPIPPDVSDYILLNQVGTGQVYEGQTPPNRYHVLATVQLQTAPDLYLVTLALWKLGSWVESHGWSAVKVHFPFDTSLLTNITIPGRDFRLARFME